MDWEPRVGMRVVCVDNRPSFAGAQYDAPLVVGAVYTIRRIGCDKRINIRRIPGDTDVWLDEVRRAFDCGYGAGRFVPLRERKTDISIFTALLTKAPTPEKEPA